MNFSKQLKKYRELNQLSQEKLAEKIYVTRQTISKWENDKSYPDIHNLVALSILFDISLDELIKGDVKIMKNVIVNEQMNKETKKMLLCLGLILIIGIPSAVLFEGIKGLIPFGVLWAFTMYYGIRIDNIKKKNNIKTYKEIIAFSEGDSNLETLQNQRNNKKYFLEKCFIVGIFTAAFGLLAWLIVLATNFLMNI